MTFHFRKRNSPRTREKSRFFPAETERAHTADPVFSCLSLSLQILLTSSKRENSSVSAAWQPDRTIPAHNLLSRRKAGLETLRWELIMLLQTSAGCLQDYPIETRPIMKSQTSVARLLHVLHLSSVEVGWCKKNKVGTSHHIQNKPIQ